jgi:hypothetical protein
LANICNKKRRISQAVRLSEEDIGIMFAALGLSPKQAEGNCSRLLNEEKGIRERRTGFHSLNIMELREP